jgi:hypothetical protein
MTDAAMSRWPITGKTPTTRYTDDTTKNKKGYRTEGATALAPERVPGRSTTDKPGLRAAPPVPVTAPRAPFVALVLVVVVAGVLGILVLNTKINENAFRLSYLQSKQDDLNRQEQQLNQQLADQESPNNLAAEATKLGLVPAGTPAFLRLPDGRVLGVPQPASSAPSVTSQGDQPDQQNPAGATGH